MHACCQTVHGITAAQGGPERNQHSMLARLDPCMLGCLCRSLLLQFGFWRVVLDEAQLVAQSSSVAAQMTSALWRRHAWVVTGTPITSRVDEIQARRAHMSPCASENCSRHCSACRLAQCGGL